MRFSTTCPGALAALLLAAAPGTIHAQPLPPAVSPSFDAWTVQEPADTADESSFLGARLLTAAGAAVVGAGLGFFASQLARGDWEDGPGDRSIDRPLWAAVGGGVGFAVGFGLPLGRGGTPVRPGGGLPSGRSRLGADEIRASDLSNAYEAVRSLRPEWLVLRGSTTWREGSPIDVSEGSPLRVYLESQLLGGIDALRDLFARDVGAIYFLDAAHATQRWGAGHPQGALLVVLAG
jgi:hypothetical protein